MSEPIPMTPTNLRAMVESGTKLPWFAVDGNVYAREDDPPLFEGYGLRQHDAALIVAAVNALPDLLDRIEELEAGLRVFARHADFYGGVPDDYVPCCAVSGALGDHKITLEDFRKARALIGEGK